jgi:hypothetical protein
MGNIHGSTSQQITNNSWEKKMDQPYSYTYTLILAVNADDLNDLDKRFGKIDLMNVEFQTVQGSKLMKFSQTPDNVVFAILKIPTPLGSVSTAFFPVRGGAATKAESDLQFITVPFTPGLTDKEILTRLGTRDDPLHDLVKHCRHYSLFSVAHKK